MKKDIADRLEDPTDRLLYLDKQMRKYKRRLWQMLGILCLTLILIGIELGINVRCMIQSDQYTLISNDLSLYFLILIITIIEIGILRVKMKKQNQCLTRSRYCSKYVLFTYLFILFCTSILLWIHTVFQIYYTATDFDEKCFFFMEESTYQDQNFQWHATIKIVTLIFFILIEILNQAFLGYALWKTYLTLQYPEKRQSFTFIEQCNGDLRINLTRTGSNLRA